MIFDYIKNSKLYTAQGSRLNIALQFLHDNDFIAMEPGRYPIQGDEVYALVQEYETKPIEEGKWEAHRKYIDIQYVADGEERIGFASLSQMNGSQDYNPDKDIQFFQGEGHFMEVKKGQFMILFPEDAHMPGIQASTKQKVRKVVVKVLV
ncbi:MAG: YhcH/YjgK/YiaL family protein [Clostridia bacterium]|nr:YhcH/YjgK/YiaL family protein [Clostridia bacterium]